MTVPTAADRPYMPGYGIADADTAPGLLPWSWAVNLLNESTIFWLSTTSPDGQPHLMPVWGVWFEETLYFSTGRQSRKAKNLRRDLRCTIGVSKGDQAVVLEGSVDPIENAERQRALAEAMADKYGYAGPPGEPVYRVLPRRAFGLIGDDSFGRTATRWRFATDAVGARPIAEANT